MRKFRTMILAASLPMSAFMFFSGAPTALARDLAQRTYHLPAQPLAVSLRAVAMASGQSIGAPAALVDSVQAPALVGDFTAEAATRALLSGTRLRARVTTAGIVIEANDASLESGRHSDPEKADIVVTGSRIRGTGPVGAPLITIDRTDIDRSGYATTQQLVQAIPQNFGGGPNDATVGSGVRNNAGANTSYGSSVNLRGLGSSSTLVLFNGNRPALGGLSGVFADLSLVPSSAIERIEVLADGASAIYGSDAVAGVVNILFRDRFDGLETRLRVGTADGDFEEIQASALFGTGWSGGHAMIAYQFDQRGALAGSRRTFFTEDLRPWGGPDYRSSYSNPGTITAADGRVFGIPRGQNGMTLTAGDLLPGFTNLTDARQTTDILPRQRTHSVYASVHQDLGGSLSVYGQGLFAERRYRARFLPFDDVPVTVPVSNAFYVDPIGTNEPVDVRYSFVRDFGPNINSGVVSGLSGVLGLTRGVGRWAVDVHGAYGVQHERARTDNIPNEARLALALADSNPATAFDVFGDGSFTNADTIARIRGSYTTLTNYRVWSAVAKADGPLVALPGGDAKLAVGAEYRKEHFTYQSIGDTRGLVPRVGSLAGLPGPRSITAGYAELLVPVFGPANRTAGIEQLDISVAGRVEHYSDVGSTTNPKLGVSWVPVNGLTIRGSYGRSFRAPAFTDLIGSALALYQPLIVSDPRSPTGQSAVLGLFGYAADIKPEKATTWTLGVDLRPKAVPGLSVALTYFDIDYRDRIGTANQDIFNYLANRTVYGGLITDSPSAATIATYYASPDFFNPFNVAPGQIAAIIDGRTLNLSSVHQDGLDVDLGYKTPFGGGIVDVGIAGTYILGIRQRLTSTAPVIDVVGTLGNPVDLRLRGRIAWSHGPFDLAGFVNCTGGYRNQVQAVAERVSAYTTVDAQIGYTFARSGALGGLRLALSASNLFDRAPPYVNNRTPTSALAYDSDKASPIGRSVALQLTQTW